MNICEKCNFLNIESGNAQCTLPRLGEITFDDGVIVKCSNFKALRAGTDVRKDIGWSNIKLHTIGKFIEAEDEKDG